MSLPTNLYNLETPLDQTHGANLMFNFSQKFLHPQFTNALTSDPRTFQNQNPSLSYLMANHNQAFPSLSIDEYNAKMEESAKQYYMEQNLKQQQGLYQDIASLAQFESQFQAQKNGTRMPNGFPAQQANLKSAETPKASKKLESAKEIKGANQQKPGRILPQGNNKEAMDFPTEDPLQSMQSVFLNRNNNNREKISLDQIASQAPKNAEEFNNMMLMKMLNPTQQEAFPYAAANLSLENQVYQQQIQNQMMLQSLPPELRNLYGMQALYQMDPNNAMMMQNARLYQQLNQESKNLEAFAQNINSQLQAQAAFLFGKEQHPQQNPEDLIVISDSPTKNLSLNMMQRLSEKNDRSAVMSMMMNYPLMQPVNSSEKAISQSPMVEKFSKSGPAVVQEPRKRPFEEIEHEQPVFDAAEKVIRLSSDKTVRVSLTESNKPVKKEKKIAIKKPEKSEKVQVQKKTKPEQMISIVSTATTTTAAKLPEQQKTKNEMLANMAMKKPQQSPRQQPEIHGNEAFEENSFGYHLHEPFNPMYYEQAPVMEGGMNPAQLYPYQMFQNVGYEENDNEEEKGMHGQFPMQGHGQQIPQGFYSEEVQFENLFTENYQTQAETPGMLSGPMQMQGKKEKEKTSAKKVPPQKPTMEPPVAVSIEEPKRERRMNKLQMIKFAYETYQDELKKPYVIDLHTNPSNPDQRIVPTKVGDNFQVDLNRFNPVHRVRVTQRRLQPLWNPDLAPVQLDEYCYRFEQIIGHRVSNQEMMLKQLIKCDLDIGRALEDTKKHQLFYKNSLRLDQRVLRTRGQGGK